MNKFIILFFTLITIHFSSENKQKIDANTSKKEFNILFVGNSLTYTNDLPALVKKTAKLKGIEVETTMIAFPNYAITDHWSDGKVQKLIKSKKYDFVIIQQGPSSQNNGRKMLIDYGKKYSRLSKLNKTKLCYFMVWPSIDNYHTFDGVINNYKDAASINNSILLPVGEIWKAYIESTNNFEYYSSDGFHPSLSGSQAAATVIVESLFGK
ncbi:lysophospholipase L1-like esterase [Gillisia mitskevichiae]|uniref:Lysophospholipase L1-like esterase n=1 Tax=Gillisia mitskevichiae TaxID=270921 RepID=A0A495NWF1_9FLAO|nr:SGNH/GDSL hydrolase family protein [Gillisia mitskevichiae]RKS42791.1 lysophospholipase L1-like esterase [Gillisia mitskevichiae]